MRYARRRRGTAMHSVHSKLTLMKALAGLAAGVFFLQACASPASSDSPKPKPIVKSAVSGIAYPAKNNVPQPSGTPGTLTILPWAGFKAAVTYTFDDSQPSQVDHYKELQAAGVPLTFYISSGWSDTSANYDATWTQAVVDGHEIGNHTVHHSYASPLVSTNGGTALATQDLEISTNATYITSHFGQADVWTMASPFGDTGWDTYAQHFYFLNRGVGSGTIGPNDSTDAFNLPIYLAAGGETTAALSGIVDSAETGGRWRIFLFHSLLPTTATWYAPVDVSHVTGSIEHARILGDVWIDTMVKVGAYWMGQKVVTAVTPTTSGSDQVWTWTLPAHFPTGMYLRATVSGGTVKQNGTPLAWDSHGFYEIALDAGELTISQ